MGIETVTCPICGTEVAFGVPRGGSVLGVTAQAPDDEHGTFEGDSVEGSESNGRSDSDGETATKHRAVECPSGHDFGIRFRLLAGDAR